jgi:hypothetical protein
MHKTNYFLWALQILTALILFQTLFFKFSASPESIYIFSKLGVEPYGRIGSGIIELIAGMLLLTPKYSWLGALITAGVMVGAIVAHLTVLGIEIRGDHGELFFLALIAFMCSAVVLFFKRTQIPFIKKYV